MIDILNLLWIVPLTIIFTAILVAVLINSPSNFELEEAYLEGVADGRESVLGASKQNNKEENVTNE